MRTGFLLFFIFLLSSCEKNIDFKLNQVPPVLVVDASIENNQPPVVVLTKSLDYFSQIDPAILAASFVHNAEVFISNGSFRQKLREYSIDSGAGFRLYFYSIDTANIASAFTGQLNTSYTLDINAEGNAYQSKTTIPQLVKMPDSLWWQTAPLNPDTNKVIIMAKITDPPGLGNFTRYFTKKNRGNYLAGGNSVFDDALFDGTSFSFRVDPGIDRNNKVSYEDNYFKRGDTITLKLCSINKATFQFWSTMEFAYQGIGNPFASPNKVLGNISNGALGAFCGYAASYRTLVVPH